MIEKLDDTERGYMIRISADEDTVKAAEMAMECQCACNGAGVLNSLIRHIPKIANCGDDRNQHPVVVAVLDKICSLARIQGFDEETQKRVDAAHQACSNLSYGESIEWEIIHPIR